MHTYKCILTSPLRGDVSSKRISWGKENGDVPFFTFFNTVWMSYNMKYMYFTIKKTKIISFKEHFNILKLKPKIFLEVRIFIFLTTNYPLSHAIFLTRVHQEGSDHYTNYVN